MTHDDPSGMTHRQMVYATIGAVLLFLALFGWFLASGVVPLVGCCECATP